jgi:signal transduction histidine kinase/CheY-like chemotaxis protein
MSRDRAALELVRAQGSSDVFAGAAVQRIELDAGLSLARFVRERKERFLETRDEVAAEAPELAQALSGSAFHSWALLPMASAAGNPLGLLSFAFLRSTRFSAQDRQLLGAVGEQCAVALDRAHAYEAEAVALRKKDEFLAMLGHEIRNPLAPIVTATNLIRLRGSASEKELAILERQAQHLVRLVDDLLDVSRITSGKLTLRQLPVEIGAVVAEAVESASKPFEDKRLRLQVDVSRAGLTVCGDHERLVQVLENLLVNAAKFTAPGNAVTVTAAKHDGSVVVQVQDQGEGIAPELLPHVFDLFTQARQTTDRRGGGLGLGLAIARSIVVAHKGGIVAESRGCDQGTTMTVRLPAFERREEAIQEEVDVVSSVKPARQRRRVLIVDDNEDGAELLAEFFDTLGYETLVANDAPAALRAMEETLPDAAILDIGLPGMDGYELAAEVQRRFGARTPVLVALTGYVQPSDRQQALASGFQAHFGKPVDMAQLAATFDEILASA